MLQNGVRMDITKDSNAFEGDDEPSPDSLLVLARQARDLEDQKAELGRHALAVLRQTDPELVREIENLFGDSAVEWLMGRKLAWAGRSGLELVAGNKREMVMHSIDSLKYGLPT